MASDNKFGTFSGVFTPSILTILGVILYMRMGWVVGNAGLVGALIIVVVAHVISISTGLSVSSIATDKKVGAGGIYYILSRSLGIPIGGAIGLALYVGTALSISLYLIGFAESFNGYFGFSTDINGLRISGSIALVVLSIIALISTSVALKTQFFILAAIVISLLSIFFGTWEFAPQIVNTFSGAESVPLEMVFAIFFPAVTGFTAGIAMSGNLQNPKKSIPVGTIAAIAVGFAVYFGMAVFLAYAVNSELLRTDYNVLMKIAFFAPAVVAGIWGATLSSALGGILGGPRILQAMSVDQITPEIFGRGRGKENEPINALILVFFIAQIGILIGELDVIARIVSMFYLSAYGFINISFFLESWANPDFQPSFKVNRWIGLLGFTACFGVMFKLDMIAMFASIIIIIGIHFWLQRKHIELETGNVWQSVWGKIVAKGLNKLEAKESKDGRWNPNVILFSGESEHRPHLLEFSKTISGRNGIVTNFNLLKRGSGNTPLTKTNQVIKSETFEDLGIFGRKIEVDDVYKGIENVATTFGFSGLDPNTVMMGWTGNSKTQNEFANMTQNLIHLDYNILFLEFNKTREFGNKQTVDIWWRQTDSSNAEMMLNIARFILQSPTWRNAKIRVLFVNNSDTENALIKSEISKLTEKLRIQTEIKVIANHAEQKSLHKIVELESSKTDLVIIGIPSEQIKRQAEFVRQTDELFESIGTTLLVKASDQFNQLDFSFSDEKNLKTHEKLILDPLPVSEIDVINELVFEFDKYLASTANNFSKPALLSISSIYHQFIDNAEKEFEAVFNKIHVDDKPQMIVPKFGNPLNNIVQFSEQLRTNKLPALQELFDNEIRGFSLDRKAFIDTAPRTVRFDRPDSHRKRMFSSRAKIYWKNTINYYYKDRILPNAQKALYSFGLQNFSLVNRLSENIVRETQLLIENLEGKKTDALSIYKEKLSTLFTELKEESVALEKQTTRSIKTFERDICIELINELDNPEFNNNLKMMRKSLSNREIQAFESKISQYASNWLKNQESAHMQAEAGLTLLTSGISIYEIDGRIKNHINKTIINSQRNKLKLLRKAIDYADSDGSRANGETFDKRSLDNMTESINYINFSNILASQEASILSLSGSKQQTVELIKAESLKTFLENQNEDVERVSLNLTAIKSSIIQSSYLSPLQTIKENLSNVSGDIAEEIYYSSNLINHLIESEETEEASDKDNILKEVTAKIESCEVKLSSVSDSFQHEISTNLNSILANLNIRTILESSDEYAKLARTPLINPKIQDWIGDKKTGVAGIYDSIVGFIVQRKQEIDTRRFEVKDEQFLNNIELTSNFISLLSLKPNVADELPFYLQKLSVVGSLEKSKITEKDENLLSAQSAINRINNGVSGGILILGETLSGKTHFSETIAKTFLTGEIVHINPPTKQNFDVNDIHFAFQKSFNKKGTAKSILEQTNKRMVLIFDDVERWWIKSSNGNTVINYLAKIIEDYGHKHYFLINSNIHSFQIFKHLTNLEQQLLSTIILSPATKSELRKVIMDRYNIAGVKLWYNEKPLNEAPKVDSLFSEIYEKSNGKIGLALNIWGSNIDKLNDSKLSIKMPKELKFPNIKNPFWKIILYHILIHNRLSEFHLMEIFKSDSNKWVADTLKEMEKAGLIYKQINNSYVLNNVAKHYVEDWLKKLKILKHVNR